MYRKILVPVDGSETSLLGLQHAILLAKDQRAALRLLHVVHDYLIAEGRHGMVSSSKLLMELRERGQSILKDAACIAHEQAQARARLQKTPGSRRAQCRSQPHSR